MTRKPGISVCMIVKNEEDNVGDALASVEPFADEIIVVDTGSDDKTRQIASQFTQQIFDFKWVDDFSAARNFAMSKATRSYQIWVDADDRVSAENQQNINSLKSLFDGKKAFYFLLENHQTDSPISSCQQLRCIPFVEGVQFEGRIHEQIFPSAVRSGLDLVTTDIVIMHMGYMTEEIRMAKAKRNLEILERERASGGDSGGLYFFLALTHAPLGDKEEAIQCMERALQRFERENYNHHLIPEGYLFLARVSHEMEDHDRCLRYIAKAGSLVDGSPQHNFHIGIIYQRLSKHREAIESFRKVAGKKYVPNLFPTQPLPNDSELRLHIAYSYYCLKDLPKALEQIRASAHREPELGRSWEWLGVKAFAFKNFPLAQLAFETATRFGGLEPRSWQFLAKIYESRGFSGKATDCLRLAAT